MWVEGGSKVRVFCKGAPESVIKMCSQYIGEEGAIFDLEDENKDYVIHTICSGYSSKCLRGLLVAYADYDEAEWNRLSAQNNGFAKTEDREVVEVDLKMVGIFGLKDPLRDGIYDAVMACHKAGINVRMVTGDSLDTARAISLEAGIINQSHLNDQEDLEFICMEGKDFKAAIDGSVTTEEATEEVTGTTTGETKKT